MPQTIGLYKPEELEDFEQNHELYRQLSFNPNKQLLNSITTSCNVYVSNKTIFCLDTELEMVTYEMQFKTNSNPVIGDFVWQTSVWRGAANIVHLPTEIFFDYLIVKYQTIITDSKQSWDGKRFWLDRINDAFDRNLNVYYFDFSQNKLQRIDSKKEWIPFYKEHQSEIWGKSDLAQMKRMVISNKELLI
jgi:hypothetical protein